MKLNGYFVKYCGSDEGLFFADKYDLMSWIEHESHEWDIDRIYEVGPEIEFEKKTRYCLPDNF